MNGHYPARTRACGELFVMMPMTSAARPISDEYFEVRCLACGKPWTVRRTSARVYSMLGCVGCSVRGQLRLL